MEKTGRCLFMCRYGQLMGLIKDPVQNTIWTFTERAIFKYKVVYDSFRLCTSPRRENLSFSIAFLCCDIQVVKESRDVWQMYLDMGKFDLAKGYCKDNPANLDKVSSSTSRRCFAHIRVACSKTVAKYSSRLTYTKVF